MVSVTAALGIRAPVGSVTVPLKAAIVSGNAAACTGSREGLADEACIGFRTASTSRTLYRADKRTPGKSNC